MARLDGVSAQEAALAFQRIARAATVPTSQVVATFRASNAHERETSTRPRPGVTFTVRPNPRHNALHRFILIPLARLGIRAIYAVLSLLGLGH